MSVIDKFTGLFTRKPPQVAANEKKVGAGPAIAAHSKDAASKAPSGQSKTASKTKKK